LGIKLNTESIRDAYRRYARHYDALFGSILHPGRRLVVESLGLKPGDRVLEVGVGTGLSLPLYPEDVQVTGVDISPHMLNLARQRVAERGLNQIQDLLEMDAGNLRFSNGGFDKVVAMYVMSVVPDPVQVVEEMRRVCSMAGEIFIVNHFHSRRPLVREAEKLLSSLSRVAGFRPDMDLEGFIYDARLQITESRGANLLGYWTILRCRSTPARQLQSQPAGYATEVAEG
jgi:phosphatidylethanolamine/phosphatidyl-N-methylethanolamine N-methyltransferase